MTEPSVARLERPSGRSEDLASDPGALVDRICAPSETLERVSTALGTYGVTRLARITGLDRIGIPVWNAIRPNARSIAVHQGKGLTDADAKASACMEAVERAVAEVPPLESRTCSSDELSAGGVHFDPVEEFLAARQSLPGSTAIAWVEGTNLSTGRAVFVPLEAVTIDRTQPRRYWQSSDGLASGNTWEEAVLHGVLERIERDADVLFRLSKPAIRAKACFDPHALGCPSVDRLLSLISAAGFAVVTLDITSDVGIPSVLAYLYPRTGKTSGLRYIDVTLGSGTHFSAARATVRALTEAVQSRLTLISGARDDVEPSLFSMPLHPAIAADLVLAPTARPPRDIEVAGRAISERITLLLSMLEERRVSRVLAVDLAPGETRFSVVKLLIPELESPDGNRKRRFGARALPKMMVF